MTHTAMLLTALASLMGQSWWLGVGLLTIAMYYYYPAELMQIVEVQQRTTMEGFTAFAEAQWTHRLTLLNTISALAEQKGCAALQPLADAVLAETALSTGTDGAMANVGRVLDGLVQSVLNGYKRNP
jgi:hypothetical protein